MPQRFLKEMPIISYSILDKGGVVVVVYSLNKPNYYLLLNTVLKIVILISND